MKDIDVHKGLEDQVLRDYFAGQCNEYFLFSVENREISDQEDSMLRGLKGWDYSIQFNKNIIAKAQRELENNEKMKAVSILLKEKGWEEHDISDSFVSYSGRYCRPFIGTQKEFEEFLSKIELEVS